MSTKKESTQTVTAKNGEKINLSDYLTTLQPLEHSNNYTAKIEVSEYYELGCLVSSLISVCRGAIENEQLDTDPTEISRVLEVAQNLLPLAEMEFLDRVRPF